MSAEQTVTEIKNVKVFDGVKMTGFEKVFIENGVVAAAEDGDFGDIGGIVVVDGGGTSKIY